jgi:alpha-beta hydrolase superfamily lysophospholipase
MGRALKDRMASAAAAARAGILLLVVLAVALAGPACAASLEPDRLVAADGVALPLRHWDSDGPPRAVVLALHGMNDYSNAFDSAASLWAAKGITTYAYDQRGFGGAPDPGQWPGAAALRGDFCTALTLVRARHPGVRLFAVGESMGGAVILTALAQGCGQGGAKPDMDGAVLSAPAVWARRAMPLSYRLALFAAAHIFPWMTATGQGLHILPSDNIPMLRALARDPLVIKATRFDAIAGLTDLMDDALDAPASIQNPPPLLILRGDKDPIIPSAPSEALIAALGARAQAKHYPQGYHMLTRDLDGAQVSADIAAWILATK